MRIGVFSCKFGWEEEQLRCAAHSLGHSLDFFDPRDIAISVSTENLKATPLDMLDRILVRRTLEAQSAIASISSVVQRKGMVMLEPPLHYLSIASGKATAIVQRWKHVPVPNTWCIWKREQIDTISDQLIFPVICKPNLGRQGQGIRVATNSEELLCIFEYHRQRDPAEPFLIQDLVSVEREYRILVLGGRVIGVYLKGPSREKWIRNAALGATFHSVSRDDVGTRELLDISNLAVEASKISRVVFAGVDVIVDPRGQMYVLECNRSPKFEAAQRASPQIDIARTIIEFLVSWDGTPPWNTV